jgi:putative PIN family toxin of toxin-antitoxin system
MKVIVDTNVIVSAALRDKEPEAVVLFISQQPDVEWVVSQEILNEYREVLRRPKFKLPEATLEKWLALLESFTTLVTTSAEIEFPRDLKDAKFLSCAQASDADYFITGDRDFTEAQRLVTTTIISVSLFKKEVCDKAQDGGD